MDAFAEPEVKIDSGEPAARQIETQIRGQILHGVLTPGEELPTVRALAVGLAISPNVVEEAYAALAGQGFLIRGDACGPRVAASTAGVERGQLDNWCRDFMCRATAEGYAPADVLRALHACIDGSTSHGESR
jgi:GntR family transcriptional regulator